MDILKKCGFVICLVICFALQAAAQPELIPVADGWANNSVNVVVFRKNSLVSSENTQFIAFYNPAGKMVLGKRNLCSAKWEISETAFGGNVKDAHNSISIMSDGDGWKVINTNFRQTAFSLSGMGTKRIPISRLQVVG